MTNRIPPTISEPLSHLIVPSQRRFARTLLLDVVWNFHIRNEKGYDNRAKGVCRVTFEYAITWLDHRWSDIPFTPESMAPSRLASGFEMCWDEAIEVWRFLRSWRSHTVYYAHKWYQLKLKKSLAQGFPERLMIGQAKNIHIAHYRYPW